MTALTTSAALSETNAREEMCRVGKSLFDRGYVHATAGNISVRLDNGFLITPTDACLGFLDPAKLSLLDAQGLVHLKVTTLQDLKSPNTHRSV